MRYYVPPRFDLFEFDDELLGLSPQSSQRRFGHWNGLISEPAREVTLVWSAAGATVLVATSGGDEPPEFARVLRRLQPGRRRDRADRGGRRPP
jgi:hypothetical protein